MPEPYVFGASGTLMGLSDYHWVLLPASGLGENCLGLTWPQLYGGGA